MKLSYRNKVIALVGLFITLGAISTLLISNDIESSLKKEREFQLAVANSEAHAKIEHSINQFATLISGVRSFVEQSPDMPDGTSLQQFVNRSLEEIDYHDSIVMSFVDTNHTFVYSFTRTEQNPVGLVGQNVRKFRDSLEIAHLDAIMRGNRLHLFKPINLVEGYPGVPMNFGVWRNGKCLGYIASIVNFKSIVQPVYNSTNVTDEFVFLFETLDGPELDRERVYDGSKIYSTRKDPEYYRNFKVKHDEFSFSEVDHYGLDIKVGTAYKKDPPRFSNVSLSLFFAMLMASIFAVIMGFLAVKANANKLKLEKSHDLLRRNENRLNQITSTINDVFYLFNVEENRYEFISENCSSIMGADKDFFYHDGGFIEKFVHPEDQQMIIDANYNLDQGESVKMEYRILVDGQVRWINDKSFPIKDENGKILKNSGICRDVTQEVIYRNELFEMNQDIKEGIDYASNIQNASMTSLEKMKEIFPESFVFFRPKEPIGGDFYLVDLITTHESGNLKVFLVADCTGHGVPGAMLTLLCQSFIRYSFLRPEIKTPAQLLDFVRDRLNEFLNRNQHSVRSVPDGMDIALCIMNETGDKVYFSGANNPCVLIRNGELVEYKGDKQSIGYFDRKGPFMVQEINVQPGDQIYMFTDGYSDQFGGPKDKRFQKKNLYKLFLEVSDKPMKEQNETIVKVFEEWKGDDIQIDDVTVLGVKI